MQPRKGEEAREDLRIEAHGDDHVKLVIVRSETYQPMSRICEVLGKSNMYGGAYVLQFRHGQEFEVWEEDPEPVKS